MGVVDDILQAKVEAGESAVVERLRRKGLLTPDERVLLDRANLEVEQRDARIRELEAEVERMRPVVTWAVTWNNINHRDEEAEIAALDALSDACDDYESSNLK